MDKVYEEGARPDETLREALARRLNDVGYPGEEMHVRDAAHFLRLADECIRQIKWGKIQQMAHLGVAPVKCQTDGCGDEIGLAPLTLAPEDWKP